jgi:hypothetical protein
MPAGLRVQSITTEAGRRDALRSAFRAGESDLGKPGQMRLNQASVDLLEAAHGSGGTGWCWGASCRRLRAPTDRSALWRPLPIVPFLEEIVQESSQLGRYLCFVQDDRACFSSLRHRQLITGLTGGGDAF